MKRMLLHSRVLHYTRGHVPNWRVPEVARTPKTVSFIFDFTVELEIRGIAK